MRLVLYRRAAMWAELRSGRKRASARATESRRIRGRRSLLRLGLSLLSDEILRHRLLRRCICGVIRNRRICLRVFAHANDKKAANARRDENRNNNDDENGIERG